MFPIGRRRLRFVRDPVDGRIIDVRNADDPWFDLDFLRDPEVRIFFRDLDRRRAFARGEVWEEPPDETEDQRREREVAARHARAQRRMRHERWRR